MTDGIESIGIHPACTLFPMMSGAELDDLAADIVANGLRHPVTTLGGLLLDGRNRVEACRRAGVRPSSEEWDGDGDPLEWVISTNLHRRHLTTSQRAMIAARLANLRDGQKKAGAPNGAPVSQPDAASLLNVGRMTVQRAAAVIEHGTPDLADAVSRGDLPVSTASEAARQPPPVQDRLLAAVTQAASPAEARKAARAVLRAEKKAHVAHNSGENEWYTPPEYIAAARESMGGIDTDPASSATANATVGADQYFTAADDGLSQRWRGRVWMNPPYAQPLCSRFAAAVVQKYRDGEIDQAVILVNNATETAWFQLMLTTAAAVCFPRGRVRFLDPSGAAIGAPLQGQAVIYMGPNVDRFRAAFGGIGAILVP